MMKKVHGQLDVPEDQPLIELVLADYQIDYGPEVWTLQYGINQQPERGEFWDTKIQRPRYAQLWPPEKTAPHTVMEIQYPPDQKTPTLLDLLRQQDPRLQAIGSSDAAMAAVADAIVRGDTSKLLQAAAVPYFRACLQRNHPARRHPSHRPNRSRTRFPMATIPAAAAPHTRPTPFSSKPPSSSAPPTPPPY
jgi:hypothetical protein